MATPEKPKEIATATARARKELYGLLVVAVFFGVYSGIGFGQQMGRDFPVGFLILAIGLAIAAIGAPGLVRRLEGGEAEALKRAHALGEGGEGAREEAEQLLLEIAAIAQFHWVRREAQVDRARLALSSGKLEPAEYYLNLALAEPMGIFGRRRSREVIEEARSLRAFVRAAKGDEEAAREDIAEVRKARGKRRGRGSALGMAALAEAIGLERRGDRAGLKVLLDREWNRLEKLTRPRPRAIVEALRQRAHEAEGASVYRQRAPGSEAVVASSASADPELDAWVEQILKRAVPGDGGPGEPARGLSDPLKRRLAEPRVRVAVEPDREEIEERAELEALSEEALGDEARRRSGPRDA
jgi:hypothetical protein